MAITCKRIFNVCIAVGSITKSCLLNVLGAGGLWALKGIIESYNRTLSLDHVFRPLYFTGLTGLAVWQVLDFTVFSSKSFREDSSTTENPSEAAFIANKYPVLYLFNEAKQASKGCYACLDRRVKEERAMPNQNQLSV